MGLKAVYTSPARPSSGCGEATVSCSHLCLNTPLGPTCACPTGHELGRDNVSCVIPEAFLIFTRRDDIKRMSIELENSRDMLIPLQDVQEASALDYDQADGRIYWSDIKKKTISRAFTNGSSLELVVEFGLDYPRGIALDWRSGNLYWSDAGTGRLEVMSLSLGDRRVLIWKELESPECIVIDTDSDKIIWSSWGLDPVLERSNLDGSDREVIVTSGGRATGLTVDSVMKLLLWTDQDGLSISYTSLSQPGEVKRLTSSGHPYALTSYKSHLYWTDWASHQVYKAALLSISGAGLELMTPSVLKTGLDYVMDIVVYTGPKEEDVSPGSPCSEAECQHLCVPRQGRAQCLCPSHYSLKPDLLTCAPPLSFLLFSQRNKVSRLLTEESEEVPDIVLPIRRARAIQSVSYDSVQGLVYWLDAGRGEQPARQVLRRASVTGQTQAFDFMDKFQPFDLVIDPLTRYDKHLI